jgi:hypothetical protein
MAITPLLIPLANSVRKLVAVRHDGHAAAVPFLRSRLAMSDAGHMRKHMTSLAPGVVHMFVRTCSKRPELS